MATFATTVRASICAALAIQSVHAAQAQADCIPPREAEALIMTIVPPLVETIVKTCTGTLSEGSYLLSKGSELSRRFDSAASQRKEEAVAAFKRFGDKTLAAMETDSLFPMIGAEMGSVIAQDIKTRDCEGLNEIFANLDSLPPTNFAGALVAMLGLTASDRPSSKVVSKQESASDMVICRTPAKP